MKNNVSLLLKWIDEINKLGREKQKGFLKFFVHLLEQAIKTSYITENGALNISDSHHDFSSRINKFCTFEAKIAMVEELEKAIYFIERNANAKMLFHALTIRLYHIIADKSLILTT